MKTRFAALAFAAATLMASSPSLAGEVEITLENVRPSAGKLFIGLQAEDQFMTDVRSIGRLIENPQEDTLTIVIPDVPDGRYALTVWHDIDGDGRFSKGPQGPTDGWTMIGALQLRGMPTFEAQSFTVSGERTAITETMLYGPSQR